MTKENFDEALQTLISRQPYLPFTVELNGGTRFEVDFPNAIVFRDGVACFVAPGGHLKLFDHESVNLIHTPSVSLSESP